ncbi:MAG: uracil-DNA glycosylase [Desulfobulbaceae bacterium]|nr:uracil-DNA glycosylase [Desulfobulbaceae bacterium]
MPSLTDLHNEIAHCTNCALCQSRTQTVPGGPCATAKVFFIGEAPGKNEDKTGLPFVGAAGRVLDEMLATIDLARSDVFITSVLKCRPPDNRDPKPEEIKACLPYLAQQVEIIQPKLIVTLGRFALHLFRPDAIIGESHGKPFTDNGYTILPVYHPAAAIYNRKLREPLARDFKTISDLL